MNIIIKTTVAGCLILLLSATTLFAGDGEIVSSGGLDTITQSVYQSGSVGGNIFSVLIGLFSAWLFLIGLMCHSLEQIPGVKKSRD